MPLRYNNKEEEYLRIEPMSFGKRADKYINYLACAR